MLNGFSYPTPHPHQIPKEGYTPSDSMIRLLAAAVINRRFRDLLLRNPGLALYRGYGGESFTLTPGEGRRCFPSRLRICMILPFRSPPQKRRHLRRGLWNGFLSGRMLWSWKGNRPLSG